MPDEIHYYPDVECEVTPSDLYQTEIVGIADETGNRHFFRVARGTTTDRGGKSYLGIAIVEVDRQNCRTLIQLPVEADSGANRLWVSFQGFRHERIEQPL